jgi:hypothetical protein
MKPPHHRSRLAAAILSLSLLLCVIGARSAGADPQPAAPPTAVVSAPATSFDAVTARLDRGGSFYLYLSAADWLSTLSQTITQYRDLAFPPGAAQTPAEREKVAREFDLAATLIKQSGLEQITGLGASSLALEPGVYRNTFFVHHAAGQETGFLGSLFGTAPHALTGLDFLPADTAAASFGDCDNTGLVTTVRGTLEQSGIPEVQKAVAYGLSQFALVTGLSLDDFLQSLGGASGMILTLDPAKRIELPSQAAQKQTIPLPKLAILIEMKNDRLYQRVEQLTGMFPNIQRTDEPGLHMLSTAFPLTPQFTVHPTVAQWGNFLVVASDDQLVRDIMAAQKSGQGFKASPAFAKLAAGLPAEGNGFGLATETFVQTMRDVQAGMLANQASHNPGQADFMQKLFAAQKMGAYGVWAHVEDGWLQVTKGPQSLSGAAVPLLAMPFAAGVLFELYQGHHSPAHAAK